MNDIPVRSRTRSRGRLGTLIGRACAVALVTAGATAVLSSPAHADTVTSNSTGTNNGYFYSF